MLSRVTNMQKMTAESKYIINRMVGYRVLGMRN